MNGETCDFDNEIDGRQSSLRVSENADLLGYSHTTIYSFTQNGVVKKDKKNIKWVAVLRAKTLPEENGQTGLSWQKVYSKSVTHITMP